jgi:GH24 family phage-related lysozyme (muramidase)
MTIPVGNFLTFFDKENPHHRAFFQASLEKLLKHEPNALDEGSELVSIWRAGSFTTPNNNQTVINLAKPLVQEFESCELEAYPDPETNAEPWTIGWGSTKYLDGSKVKKGDKVSQATADKMLESTLSKYCDQIAKSIERWPEMSINQKAALLSFTYNCGPSWYGSSGYTTLTNAIKGGRWLAVPDAMRLYVNPGGPSEAGLKRRREAEIALWHGSSPEAAKPTPAAPGGPSKPVISGIGPLANGSISEWSTAIKALKLSQPDVSTCQAACIAMAIGNKNITGIRQQLLQLGIAGDPTVMQKVIRKYTSKVAYSDNASLNDIYEWLKNRELLITHGWFTRSGHVIVLDGLKYDSASGRYSLNVADPWSEFNGPSWKYDKPNVKFYDGFYSELMIYASCVASASASDAYRIYKAGKTNRSQKAALVHRFLL